MDLSTHYCLCYEAIFQCAYGSMHCFLLSVFEPFYGSILPNGFRFSVPEYEQQRIANMAEIKKRLESLKIPNMNTLVPPRQPSKRRKVSLFT